MPYFFCFVQGAHKGLGDGVSGCRGLLPGVQRHHLRGQRGERPPLHTTPGADHPQEHPGYKDAARDPQRQGEHSHGHAGGFPGYVTKNTALAIAVYKMSLSKKILKF